MKIFDYRTAISQGYIPKGYKVWWGFEDNCLFEIAKEKLTNLSNQKQPFNLTMFTMDTHFPNGYVCEKCPKKYSMQYKNVVACSSKLVYEFVSWIQKQDFYDNTTIIICGDHETKKANVFRKK